MAVAFIFDVAPQDGLADAYDAAMAEMGLTEELPPGALFHAAGPRDGGWRAVDVWESPEVFGAFAESTLGPALAKHGIPQPSIEQVECRQVIEGSGSPALVGIARMDIDADQVTDVVEAIYPGERLPDGLSLHVNGPGASEWIAINAWRSRAERDAFLESTVRQAMPDGANLRIEDLDVHNCLTRSAAMT
jgi:hypothetical protein